MASSKPFDGAITKFFEQDAPKDIREAIENAKKNKPINPKFPYDDRMDRDDYEETLENLQVELVKMQAWVAENRRTHCRCV